MIWSVGLIPRSHIAGAADLLIVGAASFTRPTNTAQRPMVRHVQDQARKCATRCQTRPSSGNQFRGPYRPRLRHRRTSRALATSAYVGVAKSKPRSASMAGCLLIVPSISASLSADNAIARRDRELAPKTHSLRSYRSPRRVAGERPYPTLSYSRCCRSSYSRGRFVHPANKHRAAANGPACPRSSPQVCDSLSDTTVIGKSAPGTISTSIKIPSRVTCFGDSAYVGVAKSKPRSASMAGCLLIVPSISASLSADNAIARRDRELAPQTHSLRSYRSPRRVAGELEAANYPVKDIEAEDEKVRRGRTGGHLARHDRRSGRARCHHGAPEGQSDRRECGLEFADDGVTHVPPPAALCDRTPRIPQAFAILNPRQ